MKFPKCISLQLGHLLEVMDQGWSRAAWRLFG